MVEGEELPVISRLHRHYPALILAALCFGLAVLYSVSIPLFETPDEQTHFPVVQHLAQGQGLPVQQPGHPTLWSQEGSQPPLYYALAAALTSWIDTTDLPAVLYANPHAEIGVPGAPDNKNLFIHTTREAYPWHGTALAVHLVRFFSALLAAGTVLCTYGMAYAIFPDQMAWVLGAAALNAVIPMFIFIGGSVNNDNLVTFLASLTLAWLTWIVTRGRSPNTWGLLALGGIIGLACLSKLSGLGLLPLAALALLMLRLWATRPQDRSSRLAWLTGYLRDCLLVFVPAVLVAGWWYLRNWRLYGDPTGLNVMLDIAGHRLTTPSFADLLDEFRGFRMSFWGLFGHFNVLLTPPWLYIALDILTLIALIGLIPWLLRYARRLARGQALALALAAIWILVEAISLLRWTSATMASQGRLIYPAISAICLFLVLGLAGWLARPRDHWVLAGATTALLCLSVSAPLLSLRPAYPRPPILTPDAIPTTAQPINWTYGDHLRLLAAEVDREQVRPGENVLVTLYWQTLAPQALDYSISLKMLAAGQTVAQHDTYPAGGAYATSLWQPGQVIVDRHLLAVPQDAPGPTLAWLIASVYQLGTDANLPATDAKGQVRALDDVARLILAPTAPNLQPPVPIEPVNFNNHVRLLGYEVRGGPLRPGGTATLDLYWQVTGKLDRDYRVFVHLLDGEGRLVGQGDGPPEAGFYPTSQWAPGLILRDTHEIDMETGVPTGSYRIYVGLYDPDTGTRLSVLDGAGHPVGDGAALPAVIIPPETRASRDPAWQLYASDARITAW
jgi:hypothetical protein